ncbi:cytochrome P450 [Podospora didyma]|uniref:Cytochrome P450 n=1 Tax=Podospora didyma TaxID=330526 RepID=A0AAE0NY93_9PEZI|nr:cytochrome P450 [Podospora didyma]
MLVHLAVYAAIIYYITTAIIAWRRLRHFRGPFLASFSLLWLAGVALSGRAYKIRMAVRRRYSSSKTSSSGGGELIRIGPDMLITDDPGVFQRINGAHNGYSRGEWYSVMRLDPYQHTMISSPDTAFHDDVKARTAAGFSGREVPSMEKDVDEQVASLVRLIGEKYVSTTEKVVKPMDWAMVAQYFTLDSLTKVAYGKAFGYLESDSDVYEYIKTVEGSTVYFALCSDVPWLGEIFLSRPVLKLLGPKVSDQKGLGVTMAIANRVGSFIRHGLPRKQCEAELPSQLVAGSDTTANVLRVALLLIASTPRVYSRLQREIDDAIASGQISSPVKDTEAKLLRYLQACLLECLRFSPPVSLLFPKVVPPKGDILQGKFVPGGTKIAVDFFSMGRRADIYGEDTDVFRPERFLDSPPEKRAVMEKTIDLVFGYGRYMCSGKNLAWLEMNKVFVELLREFDFQIMDPEAPCTRSHHALFVIRNMKMRVTKRRM